MPNAIQFFKINTTEGKIKKYMDNIIYLYI